MSDLKFKCPHCEQSLEEPEEMLGQTIECPACNNQFAVPTPLPGGAHSPQQTSVMQETPPASPENCSSHLEREASQNQERKRTRKRRALGALVVAIGIASVCIVVGLRWDSVPANADTQKEILQHIKGRL